jgi:hypothetical protein
MITLSEGCGLRPGSGHFFYRSSGLTHGQNPSSISEAQEIEKGLSVNIGRIHAFMIVSPRLSLHGLARTGLIPLCIDLMYYT